MSAHCSVPISCQTRWVSLLGARVLHRGYATLTTSVEKGGWQKPVKGEATLKRGENWEGVWIVLSRIPQAQLQRCCRGQKRFWKFLKGEIYCWINRPQFSTFSTPPGEDNLWPPVSKYRVTPQQPPSQPEPSLSDCTPTTTTQPHTLQFHPHCSAPLNRKKKPEIHVFLFGLSRAVPVAQESRIQLVKKREEKSEAATMQQ